MEQSDDITTVQRARRIQANQAVEGYEMTLPEVLEHIRSGRIMDASVMARLMDRARQDGRSDIDVFTEYFRTTLGRSLDH